MTKPAVALRESSLSQHLNTVQGQIRRQPADADLRAQLFQLMAVQGDWNRASEQLKLCAQLNAQAQPMAVVYERSEEHTSELQSLMRISYAVFCLKTKLNTRP